MIRAALGTSRLGRFLRMGDKPNHYARFTDGFSRTVAEEMAAITVDTLILGPSMNEKRLKPPAKLRRALLDRCPQYGAAVKGEHRSLQAAARRAAKAGYNLCTFERDLALSSDLIIIVPASPGSYAELGLFAFEDEIVRKTVILFDENFKKDKSFLRYGPRKMYKDWKATIYDVNYSDIDSVWKKVEKEIQKARQRIRIQGKRSGRKRRG